MWPFTRKETRGSTTFTQSEPKSFAELVGLIPDSELPVVSVHSAMGVPAIWGAVNFISGTIAGLPLHVYERTDEGRNRVVGPLANILHDAVSDEMTSFEWRKYSMERVLTTGRSFTSIQRDRAGRIAGLFPLNPMAVEVRRAEGRKVYVYKENGRQITYAAADIIDVPFALKEDGIGHYGPIMSNKGVVSMAIAAQQYANRYFTGGGVPHFAVSGNFQSSNALNRASEDFAEAVRRASAEGRPALTMPDGLTITKIGSEPDKSQLLETQKFIVEQVGRMYQLPPTFLQDLSHGTYSNTEQQDLHFVKHTLKRWIEQIEQELNLKLFGRANTKRYVEFSVDGLLRGDFKTRMEGIAQAIQNAVLTPNEARRMENRPDMAEGDTLLVQGATVPLGAQPKATEGDDNGA